MGVYPSLKHSQLGLNARTSAGEGVGKASRVTMAGQAGPTGLSYCMGWVLAGHGLL